jgi:hypothetical protein
METLEELWEPDVKVENAKDKAMEARFHKYTTKTESCWIWRASTNSKGYGQICTSNGKTMQAHRYSYELHKGPIPPGLYICHTCDTPRCVNPDHLFAGTSLDNARDKVNKRRQNIGSGQHRAKLREEDIEPIRELLAARVSCQEIARRYGVSGSVIASIKRRERWTHVECQYAEETMTKERINEAIDGLIGHDKTLGRKSCKMAYPNYYEDKNLLDVILKRANELSVLDKIVGRLLPEDGDTERAIYTTMNLTMANYCEMFLRAAGIWRDE